MQESESFTISTKNQVEHFRKQWTAHTEDLTVGQWTNMTLVGEEDDGRFSSVKVHQAVLLPLCSILSKVVAPQEDLVILLPDTPVNVIRSVVTCIYSGGFSVSGVKNILEVIKIMKNLGLPYKSLTKVKFIN